MTQPVQNVAAFSFEGQFPLTAPDLVVSGSPSNPSAGGIVDIDAVASETTSELQNLQQDLTNRLTEVPGSNLDFGTPNTRGVGMMLYLSAPTTKLAGLPARIDHEFEQDPRVVTSATTLVLQSDGSYLVSSQIQTVAGVFGLGWSWSSAGIAPVPTAA
jgi:hypothetical protein